MWSQSQIITIITVMLIKTIIRDCLEVHKLINNVCNEMCTDF